nr:MAG TPA: hypothetical protein [Caudoviricetes sp.]
MIQHRLTVNKDIIEPIPLSIPSGNVETHELVFDFSNEWDGLKKMAVFTRDGVSKEYTIDGATRTVPGDVLTEPGTLSIGVYGYIVDGETLVKRLSTNVINAAVIKGAYASAVPGEDVPPSAYEQLSSKVDGHIANTDNPHGVTAEQVDAYKKAETDEKIAEAVTPVERAVAGKLDKVESFVRVYPGVYATNDTDGTPHLITATSDLSYIGTGSGYIPLYAAGGQLKTATPTADDSAANKGYVDGKITALTNRYELIETITLTEATNSIERNSEPDGTAYNFKKLLIYMNAALTDQAGECGVHLWDGTTLAAKNLAFGSKVTTTSSNYMMELSVEDGILHQTTPERADTDYLSMISKTAAATYFGGVKMMDKISKFMLHQFNSRTFAVGTVIKIYGVRA